MWTRSCLSLLLSALLGGCALLGGGDEHSPEPASLYWKPLPAALEEARRSGRPVFVYVHAAWCGPCRRMERDVFPEVQPLLKRLARAGLDFADHESSVRLGEHDRAPFAWARHFGVEATPGFVLLAPEGTLIARSTGYLDAEAFGLLLAYAATGAYRHATFEDYVEQTRREGPPHAAGR